MTVCFIPHGISAANNKPLITSGVDCDATNVLSKDDHEQLEYERVCLMQYTKQQVKAALLKMHSVKM